ncbi:MAG: pyridoxal-phosphate dependent enzyme, partial [Planctomycetota bacterium]|nr:pyridoxal-phosphate dependent enzyme [Planctomycetota bacterium]
PTAEVTGNLILDRLTGASIRFLEPEIYYSRLNTVKDEILSELEREGRRGYWVPVGASVPLGAVGYVNCAAEISEFEKRSGVNFDQIFFATGSGGTAAGLLVGSRTFGLKAQLIGVNTGEETSELRKTTLEVAFGCSSLMGVSLSLKSEDVMILDGYDGGGYGVIDENVVRTISDFARVEGIILDPVYTAKAASGLVGELKRGAVRKNSKILFLHTGGVFGLFAHYNILLKNDF